MNVLLLYPEFPDTFWSFKHALKFIHKHASLPPLGLLTVAAMLPRKRSKRPVDVNVRNLRQKDVAWADLVFVSAMISPCVHPDWWSGTDHPHFDITRCASPQTGPKATGARRATRPRRTGTVSSLRAAGALRPGQTGLLPRDGLCVSR